MKPSSDIPWAILVEEGDTPQDVASWLESHCILTDGAIMHPGDIDVDSWEVEPHPGDVIMTNSAPLATIRFGGYVVRHDNLQEQFTSEWFEPKNKIVKATVDTVVNMLTRVRKRKDV